MLSLTRIGAADDAPSGFAFYLTASIDLYDYTNADSLYRGSCRDRRRQLGYAKPLDTGEEVSGASSEIRGTGKGSALDRSSN